MEYIEHQIQVKDGEIEIIVWLRIENSKVDG